MQHALVYPSMRPTLPFGIRLSAKPKPPPNWPDPTGLPTKLQILMLTHPAEAHVIEAIIDHILADFSTPDV